MPFEPPAPLTPADVALASTVTHQGVTFIRPEGLLEGAHHAGLRRLAVELVQAPTAANDWRAVCAATAETPAGVFGALGEAHPGSSLDPSPGALLRLAQARARCRALAEALNLDVVLVEDRPRQHPGTPAP